MMIQAPSGHGAENPTRTSRVKQSNDVTIAYTKQNPEKGLTQFVTRSMSLM